MRPVMKALLPAAGLGTRFLPATKASPKEMLPIVDKPMIQYAVEEAEACGINEFIIVTGRHKRSIEDHFDTVYELEEDLKQKGKKKLLEMINRLSNIDFAYIRQGRPLGLGHAILRAKPFVKNEPVAVLLSDDIIDPQEPLLKTMINLYEELDCPIVALEEVPREDIHRYGVIEGTVEGKDLYRITNFVEKPRPEEAPSNLAIIGRYILTPDIFKILETMKPGRGGEYQLTDALQILLKKRSVYGVVFRGKRYDAGDKFGFLKATVDFALKSSNVAEKFREYILHVAEKIRKEDKQK
ncbi:UTP--glucose-1-phosphate uridylyltransferase [hydrothermal vent metagenome]|uniref:UTP--glucose-1-phosphate uridylyltransferase n=1 Tax=hydrothermal vent metagenome TaxID=652676 RepID=A0A3B1DAB0_9ZZZZ